MTDRETLEDLLRRAGIAFSKDEETLKDADSVLTVEADDPSPANHGYKGFVTQMGFSEQGELLWMGAWE